MECLSAERIERYRLGYIDRADEIAEIDSHLRVCPACRGSLRARAAPALAGIGQAWARAAAEPDCLDYAALADLADGIAGPVDLELASAHLQTCDRCAAALADLQDWRAQMQAFDWQSVRSPEHARGSSGQASRSHRGRPRAEAPAGGAENRRRRARSVVSLPWLRLSFSVIGSVFILAVLAGYTGYWAWVDYWVGSSGLPEIRRTKRHPHPRAAAPPRPRFPMAITVAPPPPPAVPAEIAADIRAEHVALPSQVAAMQAAVQTTPELRVIRPVATLVDTDRPTLEWRTRRPGAAAQVRVTDAASGATVAAITTSGALWTIPVPLTRGREYRWQVSAPGLGAAGARFQVADAAAMRDLQAARLKYHYDPVAVAVIEARAGLLDAAERRLQAECDLMPGAFTAAQLLHDIETARQ